MPENGLHSTEELLAPLNYEELEAIKQSLIKQQSEEGQGAFRKNVIGAAQGFGEGALAGLRGTAAPGRKEPEDLDAFEKKERIKAKIKQEFGGSGGMQILQLPGGGFAVVPGGNQKAEGVASDLAQQTDAAGNPIKLEDVKVKAGGISGTVPKSEEQRTRELSEEQQKGISKTKVEALGKSRGAKRMADQQIELISNSARLLSQTHVDALREGGLGSLINEYRGKASLFFGGEQAEKFGATETFPGLKTEIISRLMPTLTQQGDKPGSVRLVQTIFAKLELTLPGSRTPAKNAKRMMSATLTNAFNFARAADRLGLTDEYIENISDEELATFSQRVEDVANNITLSEDEQDALDSLLSNSLAPYDTYIAERDGTKKTQTIGGFQVEEI